MAYLILPSKRTRQPQGAVRVKSWVGASDAAICTQILARNIVTGETPTLYGVTYDPSIQVGPGGIALVTASTATEVRAPRYSGARLTNNFTLIVCASKPDLATAGQLIDADDYPNTRKYQVYIGTDGKIGIIPFNSSGGPSFLFSTNAASANQVFVAAMRYADTADAWLNGVGGTPLAVSGGATTATQDFTVGAGQAGSYDDCLSGGAFIYGWVAVPRLLSDAELRVVTQHPSAFWGELFAPDPRRLWFAPSGGGATIITSSGAASLVAKATAAVAATKATTTAARSAVAGTAAITSIRVGAATAKATSAGTASTTTIRTATIAARATGTGTAAATTLRTGLAAGRLTSSAETTYAAIISGTFTAAGRTPARGTAAYTSTHAATAAATAAPRGTAAATTLRTGIAAARLDARAAVTAAALVAGTVTTSAAAQIVARASVTNTTERVAAVAAMLALRGATPAAPELPVIVPPSTRTLSPDHVRLGLSPVAPAKPRLG